MVLPIPPFSFIEHLQRAAAAPIVPGPFEESFRVTADNLMRHERFSLFGLDIDAPAGVYSPHESSSTRFLLSNFPALGLDRPSGSLLEVGCGAGAVALLAARTGWRVTASDIDPVAVQATKANAARNGLVVDAIESDLFLAVAGEKFDCIVFNQPFYHVPRAITAKERPLAAENGVLHVRFMQQAAAHLKPGGKVVVAFSNCSDAQVFQQPGWAMQLRAFDYEATTNYIRALFIATPEE